MLQDEDDEEMDVDTSTFLKGPNLIKQVGSMLGIALVLVLIICLLLCFRMCAATKYSCFRCYMNMKSKIFYNVLIRFSIASYLKILMGAA